MKQYPIWNDIYATGGRKSPSDFGARDGFIQKILVGTSASNSHKLATIAVKRHEAPGGGVTFSLFIDGLVVKRGHLVGKELHVHEIKGGR